MHVHNYIEHAFHCSVSCSAAYGNVSVYGVDSDGQVVGRPVMVNRTELKYLHQCSAQEQSMSSS